MKQLLIVCCAITLCTIADAQQAPGEPTTFFKHDTIKVVLHGYADSTTLEEKKIKAYKVFELRRGDQSGRIYQSFKKYLGPLKYPLVDNAFTILNEYIFAWKEDQSPLLRKKG